MRFAALALAFFAFATPALAQQSEMDRAETELRDAMAPAASAGARVERVAPDEIRVRMPSDITFDFNRSDLKYEFMPRIQDLARALSRYGGTSIEIVGHADAVGSDNYNLVLSERRAQSVAYALMNNGVPYQRIRSRGMGEWAPIASNADEWGRSRNRRVEISIKTAK